MRELQQAILAMRDARQMIAEVARGEEVKQRQAAAMMNRLVEAETELRNLPDQWWEEANQR